MSTTRLRFAPAPTGSLHLGSARTALFNWLVAQSTGGQLILRIEDTNAELTQPELIDNIYRSLEWLQIGFDGEPIRQSERADLYNDAVEGWISDGLTYVDDGAVRFRVPSEGTTSWNDTVRGTVIFENQHIEDFVVRRADGTATFFTANAVDDFDLGITHVVRGGSCQRDPEGHNAARSSWSSGHARVRSLAANRERTTKEAVKTTRRRCP